MTLRLPVSAFHRLYLFLKKHAERRSLSEYRIRFDEWVHSGLLALFFSRPNFPSWKILIRFVTLPKNMMKPEIYYGGDFTLDLSQIKAIKKDYEMKIIIFEFKTRAEYGVNPFTEMEEMILVSETPVSTVPFASSDLLHAYYDEVVEAWKGYLKENA